MAKRAVFYTVSGQHITLLATSLYSLITHYTSKTPLDVIIFHDDVYDSDLDFLKVLPTLLDCPQITVQFATPPDAINQINYNNDRFPKIVLWRLFVPAVLSQYDTLIYLDNDTLIYQSIDQMFQLIDADKAVAAVHDAYLYLTALTADRSVQNYEWNSQYVNDGVMVINVKKYNEVVSPSAIIDYVNSHMGNQYLDQDVINELVGDYRQILPWRYNDQKSQLWLTLYAQPKSAGFVEEIIKERQHLFIRHFIEFAPNSMPWQHLRTDDKHEDDFWENLTAMKQKVIEWSRQQDQQD